MMARRWQYNWRLMALVGCCLLMSAGCGGSHEDSSSSAAATSRLMLELTPASGTLRTTSLEQPRNAEVGDFDFVTRLTVNVQASDLSPISNTFAVGATEQEGITVVLSVPVGQQRQITVTAFNADDVAIFSGTTIQDLTRGTNVVALTLVRITDNQPPDPTAPALVAGSSLDSASGPNTPGSSQISINDPDTAQTHTFAVLTPPQHGTAEVSATGLVTYTPTHGFVGVDSLTVVVTDNGTPPLSGSITFEANVCDTQLPPPDALPNIATPANTPASTTIQLASTRPQQVSALLHTSPSHGAAELAIAATQVVVTYTPEAGFTGSDPFEVAVTAVFTDGGCPPVQMGILPVSVTVTPSDLGDVDGLIAAIAAANASGTPSTVSVEPGRYVLTAVHNITGGPNGLPTITGNVQLLGTDPLTTTITRGTPTPLRLLYVAPGGTLFLSGVTLDNGDATTPEVPNTLRVGGALFNEGTTVLDNVVIMNSQALSGGGVANRGTLSATSSMIENNQAASHGGGISSETSEAGIILSDSTISANSAGGDGGGIYLLTSPAVITNSTVQGNTAQNGAGIANTLGSSAIVATVMGSTISGNLASSNGGGMINTVGSIATLTNATVSGNFSHLSGGGLYNADGEVVFFNSTVTDNTADNDSDGSGNGGGIASTVDTGLTTILLTLIAGNRTGAGQGPDCTGALTSQGYNVLGNLSNCIVTGDTTGNLTDLDPLLGPLQDNGGATATHALLSGSPAIDAGNNAFCLTEDQRALPRPVDGNGDGTAVCDIGAYEVQP